MLSKILSYTVLLICVLVKYHIQCAPKSDHIDYLPGLNNVINFKHYSGYLDGSPGDHLHYWFVESASKPSTDPVILWLNGGPGCSSLDGLFNELGPYLINEDGSSFILNDFSWNKNANVLFLEAPACVGFSYRDNGKCDASDDTTSLSNYMALKSFYKKFPEFRNNSFFITGESYGGIYIPTLSVRVLKGNSAFPIKFEGFAVGNGLSSFELNDDSIIFFAYYHGLIGPELWQKLIKYCCKGGVETEENCDFGTSIWAKCSPYTLVAMNLIYNKGLNMYNLYGKCLHPKSSVRNGTSRYFHDKNNLFRSLRSNLKGDENSKSLLENLKLDPPCTDSTNMRTYLNSKEVQKAIHVKETKWDICNDEVNAHYNTQYKSMWKQYEYLTKHVRGLLYNGDVDMACNFLGDEWFAETLGLKVTQTRQMWHYKDQVGGFVKRFRNLDVLTIRGAGHMVPQDKPGPALQMISAFVNGKNY